MTPEAFGAQQKLVLQTLFDRIGRIQEQVDQGDLDLLAFKPIVGKLTAGNSRWATGFDNYLAEAVLAQHLKDQAQLHKFVQLGTVATALLAPFVSTGLGLALEAVAVAVTVTAAAMEYKQASGQAEAARSTPIKGTELVDRTVADAAKVKATSELVMASVAAVLAVVTAGVAGGMKLAEAIQLARLRALIKDADALDALLKVVPNKGQLLRLARAAEEVEHLAPLLDKIKSVELLEGLLTRAGGAGRLTRLMEKVPDISRLGRILESAGSGERLELMIGRLGTVEEAEALLGRQAAGEAAGLSDEAAMARVGKAMDKIHERWDSLTPKQRLDEAMAELNAELETQGVPAVRAVEAESATATGGWRGSKWRIEVSPDQLASSADGGSARKLGTTLWHEGRHAEQAWTNARLKANSMSPEQMSYPTSEQGLSIPREIADRAAAQKLSPQSAQGKWAAEVGPSMTDTVRYREIAGKRDTAFNLRENVRRDVADAKLAQTSRQRVGLDPPSPEVVAAEKRLRAAEKAFDIADDAYRGIPIEKDAHAVADQFDGFMKAASKGE